MLEQRIILSMNQSNKDIYTEISTKEFSYDKGTFTFSTDISELNNVAGINLRELTLHDIMLRSAKTGKTARFLCCGVIVDGEGEVKYWLWAHRGLGCLIKIFND